MPSPTSSLASRIELWGGIECTINRVGDTYFDQVKATGHEARPADLDRSPSSVSAPSDTPFFGSEYFLRVHPVLIGRSPTRVSAGCAS